MSDTHCVAQRRDIAADITAKILTSLNAGVMPWRKPWDGARTGLALPRRATGECYRGVNTIMLWFASAARGYASPYWLTFNQAIKLGAHVRKGERGEIVVYYGSAHRTALSAEGGETETAFRFLKSYVAFNADQVEGLPERFYPKPSEEARLPIAAHEQWFAKLEIARTLTRDLACYIPSRDVIGMPPLAAFDGAETYAATLNHEAVHATAAPHRVGRDLSKRFKEAIAAEELVAEIGAAILGAHLQLPPDHIFDHAAYIENWMSLLQSDKRAFFHAAAQAQVAVDWLLAKGPAPDDTHVEA
ncbi:MAG: zincin-like metallopeptidase domain-containing protein [Terricaulis sp.]